jgi:hypothetical protein
LLSDLPSGVTLEEAQAQIALEHGQSMTISVIRDDGEEMPVVVIMYLNLHSHSHILFS